MYVVRWAASPLLAGGDEFEFDHALGAKVDLDAAVLALPRRRHENSHALLQLGHDLGILDDLGEVRRSDLFLAFGDQDEIDGQLDLGGLKGAQGAEESSLGTFLVHGAAAHADFAEAGLVNKAAFERRR